MSHEIRTPMNGVIGMIGLLLDTELSEEQRDYTDILRTSGESLLTIINDILDFSKIEADRLELEMLDFDLHACMDDFADLLATRAQEKGLEFTLKMNPGVPSQLKGDPGRLRQILINLTGNAIKFTSEGEISVCVTLDSETEKDATLRFSIRDTGIGIPPDKIDLLFDAFQQVDASTTRKFGGSGLGLTISKQLAEMMGGEVGIESEEGKGSTFWFTAHLPKQVVSSKEEPPDQASLQGLPSLPREKKPKEGGLVTRQTISEDKRASYRILLVEDNMVNQMVALKILQKLRFNTDAVANGREAISALESIHYHLVLMDCQMPLMDGFEVTKAIRKGESVTDVSNIAIIAMTASAMEGDRENCIKSGMNDYISKPVDIQILANKLEKWLPRETEVSSQELVVNR